MAFLYFVEAPGPNTLTALSSRMTNLPHNKDGVLKRNFQKETYTVETNATKDLIPENYVYIYTFTQALNIVPLIVVEAL